MLRRLLIANRGEIACRIIRTCRRLGIHAIAVYSEADRDALHVREADEAHLIGPPPARESYLDSAAVLAAARASRADAIHPGYGFLSENAAFAEACSAAGIVFVGPPASAIRSMGLKHEAKAIVAAAGVPIVPGYMGDDQSAPTLAREARKIGYPLLVKAVAGGGGKGMRIVHDAAGLDEALAGARGEAESAFGDGRIMLERFLDRPRHIEVQVFGDSHGNTVHLFERECSVQRRYQKIIEESPSPFLDAATRAAMTAAAVRAARACGYVNAGTIEFIVGHDGAFYFMEMNTRLQVEHPVTELVTGLDLVEWQLRVAAGEPLPLAQEQIGQCGHAIEARLYSEDAHREFLPSTGRIGKLTLPDECEGWRVDRGVDAGDAISVYYDPMIAKLIASGPDRATALARLRQHLDRTAVFGVTTNLPLLRSVASNQKFAAGEVDTGFVDRALRELMAEALLPPEILLAAAAVGLSRTDAATAAPKSPWSRRDGWRLGIPVGMTLGLRSPAFHRLRVQEQDDLLSVRADGVRHEGRVTQAAPGRLRVESGDGTREVDVIAHGAALQLVADRAWQLQLAPAWPFQRSVDDADIHPASPLPGKVVSVRVAVGDSVKPGAVLAVVEGMKMQHAIRAGRDAQVAAVLVAEGDLVDADAILFELEAS